jgi:hypothetical protein
MRPPLGRGRGLDIVVATSERTDSMSATQAPARSAMQTKTGQGWVTYAGILLMIGGVLGIFWGIAAIGNANFFVADAQFVISGLNTWGWVNLVIGVTLALAGFGVLAGNQFAVWLGIIALALNGIAQMLSIAAYPWWSLALFALDMLALYGLVAHGVRE